VKCPKCGRAMKLIYVSKDGEAEFYQCKGHHSENRKVYMVK
jgi:ssDNA-binding Zn-finger/Zn-ribbon topoisomerase 1